MHITGCMVVLFLVATVTHCNQNCKSIRSTDTRCCVMPLAHGHLSNDSCGISVDYLSVKHCFFFVRADGRYQLLLRDVGVEV